MIKIVKANKEDAELIQQLAHSIWYPTYQEILSKKQIDFMLERMYSVEAIQASMVLKSTFYLLIDDDEAVGFIGIEPKEDLLRIEKIYLLPSTQGKGFGKLLIDFAAEEARKQGLSELELNVNRSNNAYHFYLKQGFRVVEEVDIPYYEFILDDYIMRKKI
ncbi:GNAT family N-acetyltransferase [Sphingobacterium cellulitidis]|uniref:N-acetyltransferase n=1 Tax=Sphingobacterium cellulitidis TaxID=1768011 RepID=A0A8H9KWF5_9SPHI|nr:GNAT family N-acetyltransferase [Sphingobacterium soli]MBA8985205.1 ribosomal protein S18 acetylase RimI-like enzyme [Sphingobacterium soli]GGE11420.1 N-acetyltransferase [Sphingobacterium soli]